MMVFSNRVFPGLIIFVLTTMAPGQVSTPASLNTALQAAMPGDIVALGGATVVQHFNSSPNQLMTVPGTLIYSDDPETVTGFGRLYQGHILAGTGRIYLYHVNNSGVPAKITAVLKNNGNQPAHVHYTRKSLPSPSGNFIGVGKTGVRLYYENTSLPSDVTIPAGGAVLLDPALDSSVVSHGQLLSGIYDCTSDRPVQVTTLMLQPSTHTVATYATAPLLAGDGFNRQGTFPAIGKHNAAPFVYSTANGIKSVRVADGSAGIDPNVSGSDEERAVATTLAGGFGIAYQVTFSVTATAGKRVAVLLNPRGGGHGGYMRWSFPESAAAIGQSAPGNQLNLSDSSMAVVCAQFAPNATAKTLTIEYMPPGASNLPVHIMLVPYDASAGIMDWSVY